MCNFAIMICYLFPKEGAYHHRSLRCSLEIVGKCMFYSSCYCPANPYLSITFHKLSASACVQRSASFSTASMNRVI
jgi:hypothetical protein